MATVSINENNIVCDYGCGHTAKFYFTYSKKYCCSDNSVRCPFQKAKRVSSADYQARSKKAKKTNLKRYGVENVAQSPITRKKMSDAKNKIEDNGQTAAQNASIKMVETRKNTIDPDTGLDLCKLVGQKQKNTKERTIDPETGLNMHQTVGLLTRQTNIESGHYDRLKSDEFRQKMSIVGQNEAKRRKLDIDENGMDHYARRTLKMLNDIDENGLNLFERAESSRKKSNKRTLYKDTALHYQCSYELKWLNDLEVINGIEWIKNNVKNGSYIQYFNPISNTIRFYIPDFIISNTVYEIKSSYNWDRNGTDYNLKMVNESKLNAAKNDGYKVVLVLDGIEKEWI